MTRRGRLTLAVLFALGAAPVAWSWLGSGRASAAAPASDWRPPVVVASGPAALAPAPEIAARAPAPAPRVRRALAEPVRARTDAASAPGPSPPPRSAAPTEPSARPAEATPERPAAPASLTDRLPPTAAGRPVRTVGGSAPGSPPPRLVEEIERVPGLAGPVRVETTLHPDLVQRVRRALRAGRVGLGQVIVLDPRDGRVLAYEATDPKRLPADALHPAASLIKVVTAAAVLEHAPAAARRPCRYTGSPWRLTRARLDPPSGGRSVSLRRALATSNNQCFARFAVHDLGARRMFGAIQRLGLLEPPAPGHPAGEVERARDPLSIGRLGCGLDGCEITALGAARLAAVLARGELVEPYWIERIVDGEGRALALPRPRAPRRVLSPKLAGELRGMLVETTVRGTARRAFRTRRGPLLGDIRVAGKTGSLNGHAPNGRYEWFIGVAPADDPKVAVATLVVQNDLWWISSSQLAAEVLKAVFCPGGVCREDAAVRWTARRSAEGPA